MSAIDPDRLARFCQELFTATGTPAETARIVAQSLVYADLRGVDSHGVVRSEIYLERIAKGMIDPKANVTFVCDDGPIGLMDGGNGFGAFVGVKALEACMERAERFGVCALGVRHSNHFGTGAFYVERAVERNLALIVLSNASQTMPATGGARPFLGTNPIALGFPTGREVPFVLDMATSLVARGKIIMAAKKGLDIPLGWAVDEHGAPTTNAQAALNGAVLPMGGPKGSGLSMAIDILSGVLTGAGFGPSVRNMYEDWNRPQNVGHFFIAIDVARFLEPECFRKRVGHYIDQLKAEPRAEGVAEILYAGEAEDRIAKRKRSEGLILPEQLKADLIRLGSDYGVPWPGDMMA